MTTRFVYLADTHLNAQPGIGYTQQPRYAGRLAELLALLDAWIADHSDIKFVLHGGDMVDAATPETVRAAREMFSLRVPVYLSLGNHDLTEAGSIDTWMSLAPDFFPQREPTYTLTGEDWMVHVVPTQWCETPYLWRDVQRPHFLPHDLAVLRTQLLRYPEMPHLLCTHGEVLAVPADQVGRDTAYHPPLAGFSGTVEGLVRQFPHLVGVLGGHSHINTHGPLGHARAITASAFTETPFEFKVFEIGADVFSMATVALLSGVAFRAEYDWDRTFVQGRRRDRAFGG